MDKETTIIKLFYSYMNCRIRLINETSGDMKQDFTELKNELKEYAINLNVVWDERNIPEHMQDVLNDYE